MENNIENNDNVVVKKNNKLMTMIVVIIILAIGSIILLKTNNKEEIREIDQAEIDLNDMTKKDTIDDINTGIDSIYTIDTTDQDLDLVDKELKNL